jgi:tetratricopeptide (TPR) repeat protein
MFTLNRPYISFVVALLLSFLMSAASISAFNSGKKKTEQSPDQKKQMATEHYNEGVSHMDKAKEKAAMADSNFAFNYRATSDAKAKREYEKAVDEFTEALTYQPDMVAAHNNLGYCYRKLGRLDESLKQYRTALSLDSTYERAREYLGETYLALDSLNLATAQHTWLVNHKSIFADTLAKSIELYRLKDVSEKMKKPDKM